MSYLTSSLLAAPTLQNKRLFLLSSLYRIDSGKSRLCDHAMAWGTFKHQEHASFLWASYHRTLKTRMFLLVCIENKNPNHAIDKVKNQVYDRWLIDEGLRQDLCGFSFPRYSEKVSPKFIQLCMETPCWCPSEGHQHGGRKSTETSVIEFCHWNETFLL